MTVVFLGAAVALLLTMNSMFVVGMRASDNSLVDIAYGPAFVLACLGGWLAGGLETHPRPLVMLCLLTVWAARLGLHIGLRHRGRGEDFRYRAFRQAWGETFVWRSFLQVYMLQGLVVFLVATPLLLALASPGGGLVWTDALGARSRLNVTRMEDIGPDYARTLELWRLALLARVDEVMELGFDRDFLRKWEYYFSYCEAGFRSRTVRNYQLLLSRLGEPEGSGQA